MKFDVMILVNPKVLIAYGTRYGSTEILSKRIAALLQEEGVESTVVDLRSIKKKQWPSPEDFGAVLVGSGIRIGSWIGAPKKFLKVNRNELNKKEKKFGIFVSAGTAIQELDKAIEKYLIGFAEKRGLKPDIYDTFGAIYDLSESSRAGGFARGVLKSGAEEICAERGIEFDPNGTYEFIDQERLQNFVKKFATLVKE